MTSTVSKLHDPAATAMYLLLRLRFIAQATGLSNEEIEGPLDSASTARILREFASAGVVHAAAARADLSRPEDLVTLLSGALEAIEESPLPQLEWGSMTALLGDAAVARLVGVSVSSVQRYRGQGRSTPDDIAARLHLVTLIVADLLGSYNDFGVRRWFARPRSQLAGQAPAEILSGNWDPGGPQARKVRNLAGALLGSPAT